MQAQSAQGGYQFSGLSRLEGVSPLEETSRERAVTGGAPAELEFSVSNRNPLKRLGRAVKEMLQGVRGRGKIPGSRRKRRRAPPFASLSAAAFEPAEATEQETTRAPATRAADLPPPVLQLFSPERLTRTSLFPQTVTPGGMSYQEQQQGSQRLLAIGARHWGSASWWDTRSLLHIKIYDFAVYADPTRLVQDAASSAQARLVSLPGNSLGPDSGASPGREPRSVPGRDALSHLVQAPLLLRAPAFSSNAGATDATIMMHAARDLPVQQLTLEMQNVLLRRNVKAGGREDDPALSELLRCLSSLPASLLSPDRAHVKRGGMISFHRSCKPSGGMGRAGAEGAEDGLPDACSIQVAAGGQVVADVKSNSLSSALFDLYLGDDPVSIKAKAAAAKSLQQATPSSKGLSRRARRLVNELPDDNTSNWSVQPE